MISLSSLFFLKQKKVYKPKAKRGAPPQSCPISGYTAHCKKTSEGGVCSDGGQAYCKGTKWCSPYRAEKKCQADSGSGVWKWCCLGTEYVCKEVEGKCGINTPTSTPTSTPTPTPTGEITNTPTEEATSTPTQAPPVSGSRANPLWFLTPIAVVILGLLL